MYESILAIFFDDHRLLARAKDVTWLFENRSILLTCMHNARDSGEYCVESAKTMASATVPRMCNATRYALATSQRSKWQISRHHCDPCIADGVYKDEIL